MARQRQARGLELGGEQLAHRVAGECADFRDVAEAFRDADAAAVQRRAGEEGELLVVGAGEVQLQLRVLVGDAVGLDWRQAAGTAVAIVLAERLRPELAQPAQHRAQPIAVGHVHRERARAFGVQVLAGAVPERGIGFHVVCQAALGHAARAREQRVDIAAGDRRRQQADDREHRIASTDRRVRQDFEPQALGQFEQRSGAIFGDDPDVLAQTLRSEVAFELGQQRQQLAQSLGGGAGFGDDQQAGLAPVDLRQLDEAAGVDVVEKTDRVVALAEDAHQHLAAERGAADTENHGLAEALRVCPRPRGDGVGVAGVGQAEKGRFRVVVPAAQALAQGIEPRRQRQDVSARNTGGAERFPEESVAVDIEVKIGFHATLYAPLERRILQN